MDTSNRRDFLKTAAGPPYAAPVKRPNLLFLFPDQLRHDFVEPANGIAVRTPVLRRLAAEGVRFTHAVTPAPLCAPARGCLASGMEYDRCRVPKQPGELSARPADVLPDAPGRRVPRDGVREVRPAQAGVGLGPRREAAHREWGFSDGIDNEGKHDATRAYTQNGRPMGPFMAHLEKLGLAKAHVEDYEKRKGPGATFVTPLPDDAYGDNWIARNGIALLNAAPKDKPWFIQVNFNGPHSPWDITRSMEKRWPRD